MRERRRNKYVAGEFVGFSFFVGRCAKSEFNKLLLLAVQKDVAGFVFERKPYLVVRFEFSGSAESAPCPLSATALHH